MKVRQLIARLELENPEDNVVFEDYSSHAIRDVNSVRVANLGAAKITVIVLTDRHN